MLVDAKKLKQLRLGKNWTQQQLADQSHLSLRTVQRVEKDGVASHETVAAYCAVFELQHDQFMLTAEEFEQRPSDSRIPSLIFIVTGFLLGSGFTALLNWAF